MKNYLLDRVAFSLFGLDIYWYGLIITCAIILCFVLCILLVRKKCMEPDLPYDLLLVLLPSAIIFARLFAVLFDADLSLSDYFDFRGGGLSIIGAIIGGALGLGIYCIIKKRNFLAIADILAPLLILGQAIGRWGNYFNKEVYGQVVTDESLQWFPYAVEIGSKWYQALFFYEFVANLLGFILLLSLLMWVKKERKGVVVATYLIYYGAVRFFLEGLRTEKYILKIHHAHMTSTLNIVGTKGTYVNIIKFIYDKLTAKNRYDGEKLKLFSKFRNKTRMPTLAIFT